MNKRNYQKELEAIIADHESRGEVPRLLLHSCCAPCSSWCLEYLSDHFEILDFYYNPNITEEEEYQKREEELKRLIREQPHKYPVEFLPGRFEPERYLSSVRGLEQEKEGGGRCAVCFALRLREAAQKAREHGCRYVTTSLTISPLKNADVLNAIGEKAAEEEGVIWLPSDFKKKGGYQRSIELSRTYGLYRQNYCGCIFSRR